MVRMGELFTAMCTPMLPEGGVDYTRAGELATYLADNGSDGIVICGTTGESPTLSDDEKIGMFQAVVEAVGDRVQLIAGTGSYDTAASVALTKRAETTGVDGVMAVVPYYNKPPQEALLEHFLAVARATSLPVMLYNVPGRTATNLLPQTVLRLAETAENIISIKEAAGDIQQVTALRRLLPNEFTIFSGDDPLTLPMLAIGAHGVVSVASHVVGPDIKRMIRSFKQGDVQEAADIHTALSPIVDVLFKTTNPIPVKWGMQLLGLDLGPFRLPLVAPDNDVQEKIKDAFANYGLIDV